MTNLVWVRLKFYDQLCVGEVKHYDQPCVGETKFEWPALCG